MSKYQNINQTNIIYKNKYLYLLIFPICTIKL